MILPSHVLVDPQLATSHSTQDQRDLLPFCRWQLLPAQTLNRALLVHVAPPTNDKAPTAPPAQLLAEGKAVSSL